LSLLHEYSCSAKNAGEVELEGLVAGMSTHVRAKGAVSGETAPFVL